MTSIPYVVQKRLQTALSTDPNSPKSRNVIFSLYHLSHSDQTLLTPQKKTMVGAKKGVKRGPSVSLSEMSGLTFPVGRVGSALKKGRYAKRVSPTAAVFLTSVLQYCTGELLNVSAKAATSGKKAKNKKQHQIKPRHICVAVREDKDLGDLLSNVTIAGGGVGGGVHDALKATDKKYRKKSSGSTMKKSKGKKTKKSKKSKGSPKKSSPKK